MTTTELPQSQRAARTADPLAGPSLKTQRGRRWRDLRLAYEAALGPERARSEAVAAQLRSLLRITCLLEEAQTGATSIPVQTELHLAQEQRILIANLGLDAVKPAALPLQSYLAGSV